MNTGSNQQHDWSAPLARENAMAEMRYSDGLKALRKTLYEKRQATQAEIKAAKRRCQRDCTAIKMDVERRRLEIIHIVDQLKDQRLFLRQRMHDDPEANDDFNAGELMRLTNDIDANRHQLLELDEERQLRIEQTQTIYENTSKTYQNHIAQLNENYRVKARELREQLLKSYDDNRAKFSQEGGDQ